MLLKVDHFNRVSEHNNTSSCEIITTRSDHNLVAFNKSKKLMIILVLITNIFNIHLQFCYHKLVCISFIVKDFERKI